MTDDFGILYVATGEQYLAECLHSAESAKMVMPEVPITLWTDDIQRVSCKSIFKYIHKIENPTGISMDRIDPLLRTDYNKTLAVDTDTCFLESIEELSILLDHFEFACAHAPWRVSQRGIHHVEKDIPICFPQHNGGVIAYSRCDRVMKLLDDWKSIHMRQLKGENSTIFDQPAFRKALYRSDVRLAVLTPEYNMRTIYPVFKGGECSVKILHGRGRSMQRARKQINQSNGIGTFNFVSNSDKIARKYRRLMRRLRKEQEDSLPVNTFNT